MDIASAVQTQLRNIEATYGKPIEHWFTVIRASGIRKHTDVVAMLKADHGLAHGAAHRLSLLSRDTGAPVTGVDHVDELYTGAKATVRPLHDAIVAEIRKLGTFDVAPKTGYLSLRRRKQFAMLKPSTTGRLDLGLILPAGTACTDRLESAATFNALFSHRVRITAKKDIDRELRGWLSAAYSNAG